MAAERCIFCWSRMALLCALTQFPSISAFCILLRDEERQDSDITKGRKQGPAIPDALLVTEWLLQQLFQKVTVEDCGLSQEINSQPE